MANKLSVHFLAALCLEISSEVQPDKCMLEPSNKIAHQSGCGPVNAQTGTTCIGARMPCKSHLCTNDSVQKA